MNIVISDKHGGFGLSHEAMMRYAEIKGIKLYPESDEKYKSFKIVTYWTLPKEKRPVEVDQTKWHYMSLEERQASNKAIKESTIYDKDIPRNDPALVQVVKEMGKNANTRFSNLKVVKIPDGVEWEIKEYDGLEWVAEQHRTWN